MVLSSIVKWLQLSGFLLRCLIELCMFLPIFICFSFYLRYAYEHIRVKARRLKDKNLQKINKHYEEHNKVGVTAISELTDLKFVQKKSFLGNMNEVVIAKASKEQLIHCKGTHDIEKRIFGCKYQNFNKTLDFKTKTDKLEENVQSIKPFIKNIKYSSTPKNLRTETREIVSKNKLDNVRRETRKSDPTEYLQNRRHLNSSTKHRSLQKANSATQTVIRHSQITSNLISTLRVKNNIQKQRKDLVIKKENLEDSEKNCGKTPQSKTSFIKTGRNEVNKVENHKACQKISKNNMHESNQTHGAVNVRKTPLKFIENQKHTDKSLRLFGSKTERSFKSETKEVVTNLRNNKTQSRTQFLNENGSSTNRMIKKNTTDNKNKSLTNLNMHENTINRGVIQNILECASKIKAPLNTIGDVDTRSTIRQDLLIPIQSQNELFIDVRNNKNEEIFTNKYSNKVKNGRNISKIPMRKTQTTQFKHNTKTAKKNKIQIGSRNVISTLKRSQLTKSSTVINIHATINTDRRTKSVFTYEQLNMLVRNLKSM